MPGQTVRTEIKPVWRRIYLICDRDRWDFDAIAKKQTKTPVCEDSSDFAGSEIVLQGHIEVTALEIMHIFRGQKSDLVVPVRNMTKPLEGRKDNQLDTKCKCVCSLCMYLASCLAAQNTPTKLMLNSSTI